MQQPQLNAADLKVDHDRRVIRQGEAIGGQISPNGIDARNDMARSLRLAKPVGIEPIGR